MGMLKLNFAVCTCSLDSPIGIDVSGTKIMTELPVKSAGSAQGLSLRNRKDVPALRQDDLNGG